MKEIEIDLDNNEKVFKLRIKFDGEEFETMICVDEFKYNRIDLSFVAEIKHMVSKYKLMDEMDEKII